MEHESGTEERDIMEDMAEDLSSAREEDDYQYSLTNSNSFSPSWRILALAGAGIIILVIFIALFFGGGNKASKGDIEAIKESLDKIERRLTELDGSKGKVTRLEKHLKEMEKTVSKAVNPKRSLFRQVGKLNKRVDRIEKRVAIAAVQPQSVAPNRKKTGSRSNKIYYRVRPGDTFYGISKRHGVSVGEILRLNKFGKSKELYPGDKILIKSGK